jgi:hypothetical protein
MKIRSVGAELFRADGRKHRRTDITKLIILFPKFSNVSGQVNATHVCMYMCVYIYMYILQSALQPLFGFRPAQPSLSILSRKVLRSAVASGTANPQFGGEPVI